MSSSNSNDRQNDMNNNRLMRRDGRQHNPRPTDDGPNVIKWILIGGIAAAGVYAIVSLFKYAKKVKVVNDTKNRDKLLLVNIPEPGASNPMKRTFDASNVSTSSPLSLDPINTCVNVPGKTHVVRNGRCYVTQSNVNEERNQLSMVGIDKLSKSCKANGGQMVMRKIPERLDKLDGKTVTVLTCMTACESDYVRDAKDPSQCTLYNACPEGMIIKPGDPTSCVNLNSILKHKRPVDNVLDKDECDDLDDENRLDYYLSSGKCLKLGDCSKDWKVSDSNNALCEPDPDRWDDKSVWTPSD